MKRYGADYADRNHACYHVGASVAEKRKGNARYGKKIYAHADIFHGMEEKHCARAYTEHFAEGVAGSSGVYENPVNDEKEEGNHNNRAYKAELFANYGEYEVSLPLGKVAHLSLGALHIA